MNKIKSIFKILFISTLMILSGLLVSAGITFQNGQLAVTDGLIVDETDNTLVVDHSTNRVGIIRNPPQYPLDVWGRIASTHREPGMWFIDTTEGEDNSFVGSNGNNVGFYTKDIGWNAFAINKDTGYVGIGTQNPAHPLVVATGNGRIASHGSAPGLWFLNTNSNYDNSFIGSNGNNVGFWTRDIGWDAFAINKDNGYVGIGTSSPNHPLVVNQGTGRIASQGTAPGVWFLNKNTNYDNSFVGSNGNNVGFWTRDIGWDAFAINKDTGNVGIGTSIPSVKLEVVGETKIGGVATDGVGKAVCIKADQTLGTCSTALQADGTCTCN